ncbi:mitochondrial intermediate peptidase [Coniochaeta sp. 2T2.1]|nr:mitochondrial intermediate peptidase [Coniochaeta sp. 2T2.1]
MLQAARPRPWVCSSCVRGLQGRWLTGASQAVAREPFKSPVDLSAPGQRHDDAILRQVFDSPSVWKAFTKTSKSKNVGLFRNAYLTRPEGFRIFARVSMERAHRIVDKVLSASTTEEYKAIVKDLDRLSDLLCRVLDMADFVRVTHPDPRIQSAASEAWSIAYQYMNELNTTTGLNDQLGKAMDNPEVREAWTEEEMTVAQMLKLDFMKSAVNLPKEYRDKFVTLSQEISEVGSAFVSEMAPETRQLILPSSDFKGMNPVTARGLTRRGNIYLPTLSAEASLALRTVHSPDTRKAIYYASRTASKRSTDLLEHMARLRADLANVSGFESYGHMALRDRMMAKTPESVKQFLQALARNNTPIVQKEVTDLLRAKQEHVGSPSATLDPWDKDYYSEMVHREARSKVKQDDFLSAYFSLGTVMQGLSRIFTRLYGIRLVPRECEHGEAWHPDVRRLDVVSDTEGHIAVLYCDLFYRGDKSPNPAHFTNRCSREIAEDEVAEAASLSSQGSDSPAFETPEEAANDGMALSNQNGALKQLPTIALVCDFPQSPGTGDRPALLTYFQMETLFHEMGHAIHSFLARTSLQNVAGTRCATDLAELPSTLMEYFAADPTVLSLFARHHETDEPLPYELVAERLRYSKRFEGLDTENQILLAMLDQDLHSSLASRPDFDSTEIFHSIQRQHGNLPPDPPGTRWQGFFGHLFGYGSTYYSYLFDRVLAEHVWKVVFSSGSKGAALDRANGEQLKENLLRWGGSRDPWRCLAGTLKDERVADGDEKAMALVGSWGTRSTFKE